MTSDSAQLPNPRSEEGIIKTMLHGIGVQMEKVLVATLRLGTVGPCSGNGILGATQRGSVITEIGMGQAQSTVKRQVTTSGKQGQLPRIQQSGTGSLNATGAHHWKNKSAHKKEKTERVTHQILGIP